MTATYDGRLTVSKTSIGACCRPMDTRVITGWVRASVTKAGTVLTLRVSEDPKAPRAQIICCPFCGARIQEGAQ